MKKECLSTYYGKKSIIRRTNKKTWRGLDENTATFISKRFYLLVFRFLGLYAFAYDGISGSGHDNAHERADVVEEAVRQIGQC